MVDQLWDEPVGSTRKGPYYRPQRKAKKHPANKRRRFKRLIMQTLETRHLLAGDFIDNFQQGFGQSGNWSTISGIGFNDSALVASPSGGTSIVEWQFHDLQPGTYQPTMHWPDDSSYATNATIEVLENQTVIQSTTIDQTSAPSSDTLFNRTGFQNIGSPITVSDSDIYLRITTSGANGDVVADAAFLNLVEQQSSAIAVLDLAQFSGNASTSALTRTTIEADDFIPVDTQREYKLSADVKSGDGLGGLYNPSSTHHVGITSFDADELQIKNEHFKRVSGSADTVVLQTLSAGQTLLIVDDASGWDQQSNSQTRNLAWYGYTDSEGTVYPDYTYTRNVLLDAWENGNIFHNVALNRYEITLRDPWGGDPLEAGTAIRRTHRGFTSYPLLQNGSVDEQETELNAIVSGNYDGTNFSHFEFRPGTKYVKPYLVANANNTTDNLLTIDNFTVAPIDTFHDNDPIELISYPANTPVTTTWTQTVGPTVALNNGTSTIASFASTQVRGTSTLEFDVDVFDGSNT